MTTNCFERLRSRSVTVPMIATLAIFAAIQLGSPRTASAQPLPVTRLAYSAKFMCGTAGFDFKLPPTSSEYTAIEIHNPHTVAVTCTIKVVQDYPTQGVLIQPFPLTLPPNGAVNYDCTDIIPGFFPLLPLRKGFVEILTPRPLKVVALYKETLAFRGVTRSVSIAKKRAWPFFFNPFVRHSATCLCGDEVAGAVDDTTRHDTVVSLHNVSNSFVSANVRITTESGLQNNFPLPLNPGQFRTVTCQHVPGVGPRTAGVIIEYNSATGVAFFECEEIIQKHSIAGTAAGAMSQSMIEVQPIPVR